MDTPEQQSQPDAAADAPTVANPAIHEEPTAETPAAVDATQVFPVLMAEITDEVPLVSDRPVRAPGYRRPHLTFVAVACVFGLALAVVLPPLAGFDEGVHFLRAWHISNGHVGAETGHRVNDPTRDLGAYVPEGLDRGLRTLLLDGILRPDNARRVWSHVGDAAPSGPPTFVDFSAAAVYPPVPYLPSAAGIRVGRLFGASPFVLVLLARMAELAAFIALMALAIRRLPSRRWVLVVLALTPVALFQAATISADAITNAFAALVIADALALTTCDEGAVPRGLVIETVLATVALALCKQPYILAAGLLLLPAWRHRRQIGAVIVATFVVSGSVALVWTHWANDHYLAPDFLPPVLGGHANYANNNVQPKDQLAYLRGHPFAFAGAVGRMIADHGASIAHDMFVQVSYWHVPGLIAVLAAVALVAIVVVDAGRLPGGAAMRILGLVLAAATVVISLFLAYVGWNAVRAPRIDGYQGRYLVVVLTLVALLAMPYRAASRVRPHDPGDGRSTGMLVSREGRIDTIALVVVACTGALLLVIVIGLGWHAYR